LACSVAEPPATRADRLRAATQARVALGRVGQSLPTAPLLAFELAHARARDAVHAAFDPAAVAARLGDMATVTVRSRADDRTIYLQRPDLGRRVRAEDLAALVPDGAELAIVVADGLSATAVHAHAADLILALRERLPGWRIAPIVFAHQARVALGDEVGAALGVDAVVLLVGERPGLSAPDSLGAYVTWAPQVGRRESERNCVSNIRPPHGLGYGDAADEIARILAAARRLRLTGVALNGALAALAGRDRRNLPV
jgi:ethanolamine ammonia-lyase small subunit